MGILIPASGIGVRGSSAAARTLVAVWPLHLRKVSANTLGEAKPVAVAISLIGSFVRASNSLATARRTSSLSVVKSVSSSRSLRRSVRSLMPSRWAISGILGAPCSKARRISFLTLSDRTKNDRDDIVAIRFSISRLRWEFAPGSLVVIMAASSTMQVRG